MQNRKGCNAKHAALRTKYMQCAPKPSYWRQEQAGGMPRQRRPCLPWYSEYESRTHAARTRPRARDVWRDNARVKSPRGKASYQGDLPSPRGPMADPPGDPNARQGLPQLQLTQQASSRPQVSTSTVASTTTPPLVVFRLATRSTSIRSRAAGLQGSHGTLHCPHPHRISRHAT